MNNAKKSFLIVSLLLSTVFAASAQWQKQTVNTTAGFRGLAVASEKVIWASGTGGTVIRTVDGGKTWKVIVVPGTEKLDFRDIEAFDANTAYIISIGNGDSSRIYKTIDGGETWKLQFTNTNAKAFFDALACWDSRDCMAMSDPVDNKYVLIKTTDGENWKQMDTDKMAPAKPGEAAFAASGTCLIAQGKNNVFLISGGKAARVFRSNNRGLSWFVSDTPIVSGTDGSGIFSIAMRDAKNGVIVGGDYEKPGALNNNLAFTIDGGKTWTLGRGLSGYRSGVVYVLKYIVAVGASGSDISYDNGQNWTSLDKLSYNAVQAKGITVWAVGDKGMVAKTSFSTTH
ncbi:MAG TPA: hypothetical protein VGO50_00145 [Pyrinomonadaceae bacterium]|nr:hypothetical protein [Pyrinomonadaceae bacterium]